MPKLRDQDFVGQDPHQLVAQDLLLELKGEAGPLLDILSRPPEPYPWKTRKIIPKELKSPADYMTTIEFTGLTKSGKTTEIALLSLDLAESFRIIRPPEFGKFKDEALHAIRDASEVLGFEYENLVLEEAKLNSFNQGRLDALKLLQQDCQKEKLGRPVLVVNDRGPHDALTHLNWVSHFAVGKTELPAHYEELFFEDDLRFDVGRYLFPGYRKKFINLFFRALSEAQSVDAIILYQVSYEEASRRREKSGLHAESWIHNRVIRPQLERAYGHWLSGYYPIFNAKAGASLLVVDGNKPTDHNHQQVTEFIQEVSYRKQKRVD